MIQKQWKIQSYKNASRSNTGFSLFEMAIGIIISGIVLVIATQFLNIHAQKNRIDITNHNLDLSKSALLEFYALQGRYPCPADPTLTPNDSNYGIERCRAAVTNNCLAGVPANIKCTRNGARDADGDGNDDTVMIGALPFNTIERAIVDTPFTIGMAQDAYNIQLTYAVSEKMTAQIFSVVNAANPHLGTISILDENYINIIEPANAAHFAVFSHGDNAVGGYTSREGKKAAPCITGLATDPPNKEPDPGLNQAGIPLERENCDGNDAIFVSGLRSTVDDAGYFDDSIRFETGALTNHWTYSLTSAKETIFNTNMGNVGIGLTAPTSKLHVAHNIQAEASIGAVEFCKDGGDPDCMRTVAIAGVGSKCPPGFAAKGISQNTLVCQQVFLDLPTEACPNGEFLVGVSNLGHIECRVLE
jgi:type II secretory pathway pseudopilin PulG